MNYGLYLSAAGTLSTMHRQDVLAGNLANSETPGFRADKVVTRQRLPERLESNHAIPPQRLLEALGGGHFVQPTLVSLDQGALEQTGATLDFAIEGDGLFAVEAPEGDGSMAFTRDGRFTIDRSGHLAMSTSGVRVLGANGRPIRIDSRGEGPLLVQTDGTISRGDRAVGRLHVVASDTAPLAKAGRNLLKFTSDPGQLATADGLVRQGFVEQSNVDAVVTMHDMLTNSEAVKANSKLMQYHDFIMGQAVNTFGRVA